MTVDYEMRKIQESHDGAISMVIPKKMAESLGISKGSFVRVVLDQDKKRIVMEAVD